MQEFTDALGNEKFVVVDGQQRLRACEEFITGQFRINGEDTPEWSDLSFDELAENEKKTIYQYNFVVRTLPEMPDSELRSMFTRLNRNTVALNRQELRHATFWGSFITCIESLSDNESWLELSVFSANDVRRMLDIEFISELTIGYLHGVQNKKDSLDRWYGAYEESFEEQSTVENTFSKVLGEMTSCIAGFGKTRWRKKSDFYSLFIVLANRSDALPFASNHREALGSALKQFGDDVDKFLKEPDVHVALSDSVKRYSAAVERAASDLSNRRTRNRELVNLLTAATS